MAAPPISLRCTQCGRPVTVPAPPGPGTIWYGCPNCGHPIPVVPWRERAPLFSWEVFPHLYPSLPPPRLPSRAGRNVLLALLLAVTVALASLAGALTLEGAIALGPTDFTVTGTVVTSVPTGGPGSYSPVAGALLALHAENAPVRYATSGTSGTFRFAAVAAGAVTLNVSAPGFVNESLLLFFSPGYATEGSPSDPALVALTPTVASQNGTGPLIVTETPFGDLENFVANVWSSAVLLGIGSLVAVVGTRVAARRNREGFIVAGGAAAVTAPAAVFLLEVNTAFPWVGAIAGATIGIGAVVAGTQAVRMALAGQALAPE